MVDNWIRSFNALSLIIKSYSIIQWITVRHTIRWVVTLSRLLRNATPPHQCYCFRPFSAPSSSVSDPIEPISASIDPSERIPENNLCFSLSSTFGSFLALNVQRATIEHRNNQNVDDREKFRFICPSSHGRVIWQPFAIGEQNFLIGLIISRQSSSRTTVAFLSGESTERVEWIFGSGIVMTIHHARLFQYEIVWRYRKRR
jgi:hypothetical protein